MTHAPRLASLFVLSALLSLTSACQELQDLREIKAAQDQRIFELQRQLEQKSAENAQLAREGQANQDEIRSLREKLESAAENLEATRRRLETAMRQSEDLQARLQALDQAHSQAKAALEEKTKVSETLAGQVSKFQTDLLKTRELLESKEKLVADREGEIAKLTRNLKEEREAAAEKSASAQRSIVDLEKKNEELKARLKSAQSSGAEGAQADFEDAVRLLRASLKPHIDQKVAAVSRDARGVVVRFTCDYLFKDGVVDLDPAVYDTLKQVAAIFQKYPNRYVEVQGHTDAKAIMNLPFADNWSLASARADKVVRYLAQDTVLDAKRLKSSSASQYRPPPAGDPPEMARRVELILTDRP